MATRDEIMTAPLQHPAFRPRKKRPKISDKTRRTTVRVMKVINAVRDGQAPALIQVPIEPSHNNKGTLSDPLIPMRHYLEKGFEFPHEYDPEKYPGIYCAIKDCWDWATVTNDHENGTERCAEHDDMYQRGEIRYATSAKASNG